ncbi:MAG: SPASM domain-containing protein, partial [Methanosarcinales archaeon]|nr:SPASM domain-containing protein [Methanosarcinales archaeon]
WKLMHEFKDYVDKECADCSHIKACRGGCPYNAIAPTEGEIKGVDPHCIAYKRIFDEITDRLNKELFGGIELEMASILAKPGEAKKAGIMAILSNKST